MLQRPPPPFSYLATYPSIPSHPTSPPTNSILSTYHSFSYSVIHSLQPPRFSSLYQLKILIHNPSIYHVIRSSLDPLYLCTYLLVKNRLRASDSAKKPRKNPQPLTEYGAFYDYFLLSSREEGGLRASKGESKRTER